MSTYVSENVLTFEKITDSQSIEYWLNVFDVYFPRLQKSRDLYQNLSEKFGKYAEFYLAKEAGQVVGITVFYANDTKLGYGYISLFGVKEEYRRKGYGIKMMQFTEDVCKKKKMKFLRLEVSENNFQAQNFYKKIGFFQSGNGEGVLIMNKALDNACL